jgi:hypothetical protein
MRLLLQEANVAFEEGTHHYASAPKPVTHFVVRCPKANRSIRRLLDSDKTLPWRWLGLSYEHRLAILDESRYWDSHQLVKGNAFIYSSAVEKNRDVLQALAAITGMKSTKTNRDTLSIRDHSHTRADSIDKTEEPYTGPVVCLSVPSSYVLVRANGKVLVSSNCNFGLPMGMTAVGLCLELRKGGLDVSEDDAQRWINEADQLYTAVPIYKAACIAEAQRNGFVRCLSGRIRYIGGIRSRNERVRAEAERFAFSTKIQEGAQTLGKGMLANAWREIFVPLRTAGYYVEPVLWVHDDLLSEVDDEAVSAVAPLLHSIMTTAPPWFSVPLATKPEAGKSWADLQKVTL